MLSRAQAGTPGEVVVMILTHGPSDVCLGDWFVLTESVVWRFPSLPRAIERLHDVQRSLRVPDPQPARSFFVHWSNLTDEERDRVFAHA